MFIKVKCISGKNIQISMFLLIIVNVFVAQNFF